jgi:hypothetical protein
MREKEFCLWLLLLHARLGLDQFVAEDNTVVCKEQERMLDGSRAKRDMMTAKLAYNITDRLHVCVCDDKNSAVFFEKIAAGAHTQTAQDFPAYIQDIITDISYRCLIYVPPSVQTGTEDR